MTLHKHNRTKRLKNVTPPAVAEEPRTLAGHPLQEGDRLGNRYRLERHIGTGGMSVIWRAWDEALQRSVAVKVIHAPLTASHGDREMIRREARAAARIEHPYAIGIYDIGETITSGGRLTAYVVMRLLDGCSLADLLENGPLMWREASEITHRIADILAAAHDHGIVHRDVTAENVMLTTEGAQLLDFGIAAWVGDCDDEATSPIFGTPPYVAPERLHGAEAAGAADIYALGVLMFHMLKGRFPYPEITWEELEKAKRSGKPPRLTGVPGLPSRISRLCRRCLANTPDARPTAAEIVSEIADVLLEDERGYRRHAVRLVGVTISCIVLATTAIVLTGPTIVTPNSRDAPRNVSSPSSTRKTSLERPDKEHSPISVPSPVKKSTSNVKASPSHIAKNIRVMLQQGVANGSIRGDVSYDILQQVDALAFHPSPDISLRKQRLDDVRRLVQDRIREQAITQKLADDLDDALIDLGAAIEYSSTQTRSP